MQIPIIKEIVGSYSIEELQKAEEAILNERQPEINIEGEDEGEQGDAGREGGHEDGRQAFEGASGDHARAEAFAFVTHEVEVVGEEHDVVAGGDTGHRYEAHQGAYADFP